MISENTKNALSRAVIPAIGVAAAYYLVMCSIFGMGKGACLGGAVFCFWSPRRVGGKRQLVLVVTVLMAKVPISTVVETNTPVSSAMTSDMAKAPLPGPVDGSTSVSGGMANATDRAR